LETWRSKTDITPVDSPLREAQWLTETLKILSAVGRRKRCRWANPKLSMVYFAEMFRKLFGSFKSAKPPVDSGYRGDYGDLLLPPSAEAATIFRSITEVERTNLKGLLKCAQKSYESAGQQGPITFHPEARSALWGAALSKLADHFREEGNITRALFFALAAWNISKHPIYAYNSGILARSLGDLEESKRLLNIYLDGYQSIAGTVMCALGTPEFTANDFERLAGTARRRLVELK
jgi:hypothetical protein